MTDWEHTFIGEQRVARLAMVDVSGQPAVIPIVYAFDGAALFTAVDAKPKRVDAAQLQRVRNINANPHNTGENEMIKVSVFYPNDGGKSFDMGYYCNNHIPMVQQKLGSACKEVAVEHGLGGATPGAPATFIAMGHMYFDSVEAFQTAFGPHAEAIMGDIPNYTDIQPTIQISEVKI